LRSSTLVFFVTNELSNNINSLSSPEATMSEGSSSTDNAYTSISTTPVRSSSAQQQVIYSKCSNLKALDLHIPHLDIHRLLACVSPHLPELKLLMTNDIQDCGYNAWMTLGN
jgi:hypothetical protein